LLLGDISAVLLINRRLTLARSAIEHGGTSARRPTCLRHRRPQPARCACARETVKSAALSPCTWRGGVIKRQAGVR
jgi:hypothetical protein